jgi:hypothetical protein
MPRGEFRPQIFRPAKVGGTLRVGAILKEGSIESIYRLEAETAEYTEEGPATIPELTPRP